MAVNFPSNPTNGQTITVSGITYAYDSTQGVWSDSPQGLTQAIDALTDVDTSTTAPTNGQILQWNSTDGEWQPADSSAGVTVYATIDDLPLTGVTEGSMALVDSTDKLYIFSDTGWYSISIVNTTPTISGVSATYTLAADGTATTVTVSATDPEGIPLTYSIVSDTSGNIATVTQGTGLNTNVWTITPSTNSANAGSFTLVFRASDGTNVASASSTFTLVFTVVNSNYTTALITSVGANNAVNNAFDDASTNNHTITANGNVTQNTFSPYRHSGYSTYFGGSGDRLNGPTNDASLNFGTGDFTIEFWFYNDGGSTATFFTGAGTGDIDIAYDSSGLRLGRVNTAWDVTQSYTFASEWTHIAVVRTSSTVKFFANGTQVGSDASNSSSYSVSGQQRTGLAGDGTSRPTQGYITDLRIVKGTAVYTSAFTPPTERLTAVTNTSLLTCHLPYIADGSTNNHSITVNGNTKTEPLSPYDHSGYSAALNGGSMYFDGSGDYLTTSAIVLSNSTAFTIEMWYYNTSSGTGEEALICQRNVNSPYNGWRIFNNSGATDQLRFYNGTSWVTIASNLEKNQWHHIAVVSQGSGTDQGQCYLNGVAAGSAFTTSSSINYSTNLHIGTDNGVTSRTIGGYLSDVRVVNGTAVYTSAFTPPTAPLTAITNTALLLNGTDAGIIDKSQSTDSGSVVLFSGAKSSTAQSKYLTSSIALNGTSDYMRIYSDDGFEFGNGDFTLECWIYTTTTSGIQYILDGRSESSTGKTIMYLNSGQLILFSGTAVSSATLTNYTNTWIHVAVVRNGNTIQWYVDGTASGSAGTATSNWVYNTGAGYLTIGRVGFTAGSYWNGYLSDLRITKGLARYTSNFTAPSAALGG